MIIKTPLLIFVLSMFLITVLLCGQGFSEPKPVCAGCGAAIWKGEPHRPGCPYAPKKTGTASGPKSSEDFAVQMMGSLFGSLLGNILSQPSQPNASAAAHAAAEAKKKQEEAKKKQAMEQWKKLQKKLEKQRVEAEAQKKKRGQEVFEKIGGIGEGGKLEPFKWGTSGLEAKPIGAGAYDTSGYTSWQRLLASVYFSSKALEEGRNGNLEGAAFMNSQTERVMAGEMTQVECQLPGLQQLADIQRQNFKENKRITEIVKLLPVIQKKVKHLQQIEVKLNEAKKEKADAEEKLEEIKVKVEEAKAQAGIAQTPEEKTEADDLLQQALALQDEASAQLEEAKQKEDEYAQKREDEMKELKSIKEKIDIKTADK